MMNHLAMLMLLAVALFGCQKESAATGPTDDSGLPDPAARVVFEPLQRATEQSLIHLPAEVVLPPQAMHRLAPTFSGRLLELTVAPGTPVTIGQPLGTFASADLVTRKAALAEARKRVSQRQKMLKKQRTHVEAGMQPVQTIYAAEEALADARARVAALQQEIDAWEQQRGASDDDSGAFRWLSPVSGVVDQIHCSPGTMVGPQDVCLVVLDIDQAMVRVHVPERRLPDVGAHATLEWWATGTQTESAQRLDLVRSDAALDPSSRTLGMYFSTADGLQNARIGATGHATVVVPVPPAPTYLVPRSALTRLGGVPVVFVPSQEAPGMPVEVDVLGRRGSQVLIRGEALNPKTTVATRGVFLLKSTWLLEHDA